MKKLIINCSTGREEYLEMSDTEILEKSSISSQEFEMPTEKVFVLPIKAPQVTAEEFIVQSPKPKKNAREAIEHAKKLSIAKDKPVAEILLNLMVYIGELEARVSLLENNK